MASPIADFVVSLGIDGRVLSQGGVSDALANDRTFAIEISHDEEIIERAESEIDLSKLGETKQSDGKLILKEEVEEGHVSWSARA
jgi:hypothetical protein